MQLHLAHPPVQDYVSAPEEAEQAIHKLVPPRSRARNVLYEIQHHEGRKAMMNNTQFLYHLARH